MNVSLTPELEQLVARKVESGLYQSASEVIRASLRLLDKQDTAELNGEEELGKYFDGIKAEDRDRFNELRKKIQVGLDQLDRGEGIPGHQVYAEMKKKSAEFRKAKA